MARLVSTRMRGAPLPMRLSYVQSAYLYEEPQEGRMREFTQAGVELIGSSGVDADAESLFMAIEALDEIGMRDASFDINDAAIVDGILAGLALEARRGRGQQDADRGTQHRRRCAGCWPTAAARR